MASVVTGAIEVFVRGVLDPGNAVLDEERAKGSAPMGEERSPEAGAVDGDGGPDAGESVEAGAAGEAHRERLGVVVEGVRGEHGVAVSGLRERGVPRSASGTFNTGALAGERRERDALGRAAEPHPEVDNGLGHAGAGIGPAVLDVDESGASGRESCGEGGERNAVGPSGAGDDERAWVLLELFCEVGLECVEGVHA